MKKHWFLIVVLVISLVTASFAMTGCQPSNTTAPSTTSQTTGSVTTGSETSASQTTASETTGSETTGSETSGSEPTTMPTTTTPVPGRTVTHYFPLMPNLHYKYAGTGNEYMPMDVYVEYIWPGKMIQLLSSNAGNDTRTLYTVGDGQVTVRQIKSGIFVREDLSDLTPLKDGEILLKEPLVVGTTWKVYNNTATRTITGISVPVKTPAGTFYTLEVTTKVTNLTIKQYYAAGVGFIKMLQTGEYEVSQTLASTATIAPWKQPLTLYYPRATQTDFQITYTEISVNVKTNTGIKELLTRYFQTPIASGLLPLIGQDVRINSVHGDAYVGLATIDFSKNLVTSMNLGSGAEAAVVRCIVNTVGQTYGFEKVMITLDGQPYVSGHIQKAAGEYFTVDLKNRVKLY
jgi:hypothetical protein